MHVHEPAHALEAFDVGARSTQGSDELVVGLAQACTMLGRHDRALLALRGAVALSAPSEVLLEALAESAEHAGAFTEALAARRALLARAHEAGPLDPATLSARKTGVLALELMIGSADRLNRARCNEQGAREVLWALLGC